MQTFYKTKAPECLLATYEKRRLLMNEEKIVNEIIRENTDDFSLHYKVDYEIYTEKSGKNI